ncbi:MAG: MarR family transcriptional regulator [Acidocella sp.]|nr:MarR family transcriptional regulator [Acidocella sp.]
MRQDFEYDLFFLLHDVARLARVEADRRARLQGMTRAQWALLLRLERHPGLSQKEAADLLEVEPISLGRLVDRMEAAGLVERRADGDDRRIWRLHLRPAATAQLAEIARQRVNIGKLVTAGMAPSTRAALIEGLSQMKANLQQTEFACHDHVGSNADLKESA